MLDLPYYSNKVITAVKVKQYNRFLFSVTFQNILIDPNRTRISKTRNERLTPRIADYFWTRSIIWSRVTRRFKSSV